MAASIHVDIVVKRVASDAEVAALIEPAMRKLLAAMASRARRAVPKRTWALHDTIAHEVTREGAVVVGTLSAGSLEVDYARHVELGTSRAKAQPYLRPAVLQSKGSDLA